MRFIWPIDHAGGLRVNIGSGIPGAGMSSRCDRRTICRQTLIEREKEKRGDFTLPVVLSEGGKGKRVAYVAGCTAVLVGGGKIGMGRTTFLVALSRSTVVPPTFL